MQVRINVDSLAELTRAAILRASASRHQPSFSVGLTGGGRRGQAVNTVIAKVQAKSRRNPFFFAPEWRSYFRELARMARKEGAFYDVANEIGEILKRMVRENVEHQENKSGSQFRQLTPAYALAKMRRFGNQPILRASGDLLDGLATVVTRSG